MAPVKWNGEEQLALGPSGTYNTILADQFKQAFRALANEVEADLGALYFGASRAVGTAGTTPFGVKDDLSDAALARQVLEDNGAPTTDLQMVLGSTAIANLRGKQSVLFKVNESGTEQLLREGVLGRLEGFNIHSSAGVKRAPKVAATGYLVNGEKKEGDVLISIDTGSGSISAGQIVTFAGDPNQYVVAAATSNLITLAAPGLRQDLADDTAITVVGAFTANMAFDRNAFLLASRTPAMPEGGDNADDVMNVTEGNTNISGVTVVFRAGEQEQTPPEGFESSGSETVLGTEVKYGTPITRTITSANIDRLRFTFGVQALVETTSKGDRNPSEVRLLVQIQRNGGWVTEKDITIKGKTTSQYLASVVVDNLPPRPFNIRMRRMTPDSTTDQLQNKTLWSSYTEIIDVKQCYAWLDD